MNKGLKLTWEEKKANAEQLKHVRNKLKEYKAQKLLKRKEDKLRRKEKKKLKELSLLCVQLYNRMLHVGNRMIEEGPYY